MFDASKRIRGLDLSLFDAIPTQTTEADRRALLGVHRAVMNGRFAYLEIGSHLGGSGADGRLALGHRRLAVIDLDERAAQPMVSACGRFVLSFNGEIYNYRELRKELVARGCRLRTTSDTEVLLELFAREGKAALSRLRGMFALALWDERERVLWLARDPYGIKPLYYADDGWTVRAASQVKALLAGGGVAPDPEPAGIVGFFLLGSVPEPFTCFQEIRAVPAGAIVHIDRLGAHAPEVYAAIGAVLREGERTIPVRNAQEEIRAALLDSVCHHLVADVRVGLFLSSGIDSGALLALMAEARGGAGEPIRAITVAFPEYCGRPDDEAPLAAELAVRFGAEHTVRVVDEEEFAADLPRLLEAMDQPTVDGVNTWFVSKEARELGLKVALSGLGGDELFAGYPSLRSAALGSDARDSLARSAWGQGPSRAPHPAWRGARLAPEARGPARARWHVARGLSPSPRRLYALGARDGPPAVRAGLRRLRCRERIAALLDGGPTTPLARVALLEAALYMRHQLLRDTDWSSMAHSLEVRVPLVDVALLGRVAPLSFRGKALLAASTPRPLPQAVLRRTKTGFTTPVARWTDRLSGHAAAAHPEPWARRWARTVAQAMLPEGVLRHRPSQASVGVPARAEVA